MGLGDRRGFRGACDAGGRVGWLVPSSTRATTVHVYHRLDSKGTVQTLGARSLHLCSCFKRQTNDKMSGGRQSTPSLSLVVSLSRTRSRREQAPRLTAQKAFFSHVDDKQHCS